MSLDHLRTEIDRIDRELLRLLAERQRIAAVIGETKRDAGRAIYAPDREEALLRKLESIAPAELKADAVRGIFREIISASVGLQLARPVAFLGPEGTFTHQAALKNFGHGVALRPLSTIDAVFAGVGRGEFDYGVVPVENANEGSVVRTLDLLAESELKVVAQIYLPIEQCLIGHGPLENVRRVASKDIALEQCRGWLANHLPGAELVPVESTAAGVRPRGGRSGDGRRRLVRGRRDGARPGPRAGDPGQARQRHAVPRHRARGEPAVRRLRGQDERRALAAPQTRRAAARAGTVRPARDQPRASNPAPARGRAWEYLFFIDFTGHWNAPEVRAAFAELEPACERVKWLGSYPNLGQ